MKGKIVELDNIDTSNTHTFFTQYRHYNKNGGLI